LGFTCWICALVWTPPRVTKGSEGCVRTNKTIGFVATCRRATAAACIPFRARAPRVSAIPGLQHNFSRLPQRRLWRHLRSDGLSSQMRSSSRKSLPPSAPSRRPLTEAVMPGSCGRPRSRWARLSEDRVSCTCGLVGSGSGSHLERSLKSGAKRARSNANGTLSRKFPWNSHISASNKSFESDHAVPAPPRARHNSRICVLRVFIQRLPVRRENI